MSGNDGYTKLLLHCNGIDGSTTFIDSSASAHIVTATGCDIDTSDYKFGGASGQFAGGERLEIADSSDFDLGSNDFTIDFWIKVSAYAPYAADRCTIINQGLLSSYLSYKIVITADGSLQFRYTTNGSSSITIDSNVNLSLNIWYHVAVVRDGNTLRFFVGGIAQNTGDLTGVTIYNSPCVLNVGQIYAPGYGSVSGSGFFGWIDEIRFSNGIARWISDFTPPSSEYTYDDTFKDINTDIRVKFEDHFKDVDTDFRVSKQLIEDINTDLRVKLEEHFIDIDTDIRVMGQFFEDINTDIRVAEDVIKDIITDFRVAQSVIKDIDTDLRVVAREFKDIATDIRVAHRISQNQVVIEELYFEEGRFLSSQDVTIRMKVYGALKMQFKNEFN